MVQNGVQLAVRCLPSSAMILLTCGIHLFSSEPEGFALGDAVTSVHAQSVLYCVASNFLEVKQVASALIRQLPPSAVGLQVNMHVWRAAATRHAFSPNI